MLQSLRELADLLSKAERRRSLLLFALMLAIAVSEVAGVASIMPFLAVLAQPELIESNRWIQGAYSAFGATSTKTFLISLGAAFFLVLIASLALKGVGIWAQLRFSQGLTVAWSTRLVRAYLYQPYPWFLLKNSADLANAVLTEVDAVVSSAVIPAMQSVAQGLVACALLLLLLVVDPLLALTVGLLFGGGFAFISAYFRRQLQMASTQRVAASRLRHRVLQEAFGGIKDLKLGNLEGLTLARFQVPSEERRRWTLLTSLIEQLPSLAMQALLFGGMLLVIMYLIGSKGSFQQAIPIVGLYAFAGYRLMPAVQRVYEGVTRVQGSIASIRTMSEDLRLLERAVPPTEEVPPVEAMRLKHELSLEGVVYTYPQAGTPALQRVSLTIAANTTVGLVGATGSGKTTLVDLLLGLLPPDSGRLLVDGVPVNSSNLARWQAALGYVPQQIFLTDDTVAANIALGLPKERIDLAAVERAARAAELHEFVVTSLPYGYNTVVGERGVRLSGGQRQRIGIARALYRNPDVLVLDEATSALDNVTEHAVIQAVGALSRQKTIIMIAHRLSTVKDCDMIVLMEKGRIVACGTYGKLLEENAQFQKLASFV